MNEQELNQAIADRPFPKVTKEDIEARIARVDHHVLPGNDASPGVRVTICQITLDNGFSVRGESACVDPRNYDKDIGESLAHKDAFSKLWPLFGFLLAETRKRGVASELESRIYPAPAAMRAKLKLSSVQQNPAPFAVEYENLRFNAVGRNEAYPEDGLDENNTFARYTPQADLTMVINNPALLNRFKEGQEFYVDFTEVDKASVLTNTAKG